MGRELFGKILEEVKGFTGQLYFHVMGEPLLHPGLGAYLDMCREHGLKVNITTNGTLIERNADVLLSKPALRQVNFSLHSFEANYRSLSIDTYLDRIFEFAGRSLQCEKLLIGLRLWNISGERNALNSYILRRIEKQFNLDTMLRAAVTPVNGLKLAGNIFLHVAEAFDWPDAGIDDISCRGFCYGLRDQAAILADGTVVPCCLDSRGAINLGNIREQSFESIIHSRRAEALYEGFSRREAVEPLCRKCGYRTRFDR